MGKCWNPEIFYDQWPNLKNLSGGLNLSRGLSWLVPLKIVSNVSRFKPALNLNRVLADLNRGSNPLNSISGSKKVYSKLLLSPQGRTYQEFDGIKKIKIINIRLASFLNSF